MGRSRNLKETRYEFLLRVVPTIQTDLCVEWPFARLKSGYGFFHLPGGTVCTAHRMAYKIKYGDFPPAHAAHDCDNRPCFNPSHLSAKTPKQNAEDKVAKNRQQKGHNISQSVLTEDQVRAIRSEYRWFKVTMPMLAKKYGVSKAAIQYVLNRKNWKHLK